MLKELHIDNIAVIEHADIEFAKGLNVLTGETGAGKSIIIDSLNAVLGNRTNKELVRKGSESAMVTAVFELDAPLQWLSDNDIDAADELILQRKISAEGKSSCRISGVPVTAAQLRELASELVDIHGQNDGLRLLDEKCHLGFLDRFGSLENDFLNYKNEYSKYSSIAREIKSLSMDNEEKMRLCDSLKYQISELEKAGLKIGEYDYLCERRDLLRNSEKLRENLDSAIGFLSDGEENAVGLVSNADYFAQRAARYANELNEASVLIQEASESLTSAVAMLNDFRDSLDFSPNEYDEIESRIAQIDRLGRKYNTDESGLIEYYESCRKKLEEIEYSEDKIILLQKDLKAQERVCLSAAGILSEKRHSAASRLEKRIVSELKDLNMPSVSFAVDFKPVPFGPSGSDEVSFLMSANAGENPGKISRIASGGELSRIMLALKNVFAEHDTVQTMIFDEIDAGVSGISAQRIAEKLFSVSKNRQVMCVSHLPQIAAMADSQYLVRKNEHDGRTFTQVLCLDESGRSEEIARLYGGDNITQTTLAAATEQLAKAKEYKETI